MRAFIVSLSLAWSLPASALECIPVPYQALTSTQNTPGAFYAPQSPTENIVPVGEIWLVKAAGLGQHNGPGMALDYKIQLDHRWPDGSFWYGGVAETSSPQSTTPVLSFIPPSTFVLEANERLSLRVANPPSHATFYLMYFGWKLPAACLARVLGLETPLAGTGGAAPVTLPDFTAFKAAVTSAATALQAIPPSVP